MTYFTALEHKDYSRKNNVRGHTPEEKRLDVRGQMPDLSLPLKQCLKSVL